MLTNLRIKNLAVVDDASVSFSSGLNVITGETGAGKSMLADALQLLLGERADKSLIRTGADQSMAEAAFSLQAPETIDAILTEAGLEPCIDGELIIRRTIAANGPGRIHINDAPATLQGQYERWRHLLPRAGRRRQRKPDTLCRRRPLPRQAQRAGSGGHGVNPPGFTTMPH